MSADEFQCLFRLCTHKEFRVLNTLSQNSQLNSRWKWCTSKCCFIFPTIRVILPQIKHRTFPFSFSVFCRKNSSKSESPETRHMSQFLLRLLVGYLIQVHERFSCESLDLILRRKRCCIHHSGSHPDESPCGLTESFYSSISCYRSHKGTSYWCSAVSRLLKAGCEFLMWAFRLDVVERTLLQIVQLVRPRWIPLWFCKDFLFENCLPHISHSNFSECSDHPETWPHFTPRA